MSSDATLLGIPTSLVVQGLTGFLVFFYVWKNGRDAYKATTEQMKPNPIMAGVSMAWDRDMQERFLQLLERMALAAEAQAGAQAKIANDQQRKMNERIEDLLEALDRKERDISAVLASVRRD